MYKKINKFLIALGFPLLFATCTTNDIDKNDTNFSSTVDLTASKFKGDQSHTTLWYSFDNGATFIQYPVFKAGQKFLVKISDDNTGKDLRYFDCLSFDWSGSNPKPNSGANSDIPEFTFSNSLSISAKIGNSTYSALYDPAWLGDWKGDETNSTCCGGTDKNVITADPSVAHRFHMDNFWGDGVDAYFDLVPSTSAADQNLILPAQTTSEGGVIAASTGTYDQCSQTFTVVCDYNFPPSTTHYVWTYEFHR